MFLYFELRHIHSTFCQLHLILAYPYLWFQQYQLEVLISLNNHSLETRVWLITILSFTGSGVRLFLENGAWRWMDKGFCWVPIKAGPTLGSHPRVLGPTFPVCQLLAVFYQLQFYQRWTSFAGFFLISSKKCRPITFRCLLLFIAFTQVVSTEKVSFTETTLFNYSFT